MCTQAMDKLIDMPTNPDDESRVSRRRLIQASAVVAGAAWAVPTIDGLVSVAGATTGSSYPKGCTTTCCISDGFSWNNTPLDKSCYVWFSAQITEITDAPSAPFLLTCSNQKVTFPQNGPCPSFDVTLPDCSVTILSSGSGDASCSYGDNAWSVQAPADGGNVFCGGGLLPVAQFCDYSSRHGLPGGAQPTWCCDFVIPASGCCISWQVQAAVYTSGAGGCASDWNKLVVQPCDAFGLQQSGKWSRGGEGSHACTPHGITAWCTGGAGGGGASNCTGSHSSTGRGCCPK